ncbi:hypothetical protein GCM10007978_40720 [Shewanella hanedai]|uniref:Uncharacterized protein n=1 Tax=Shewanella hanedai TaxID=25 RepID=A0A553JKQ7_SHEHA|nr:hypothetical protein [Shewanella hanedai]TRY13018.1 hypothetical protein FN961_17240 [Shewanella hanedai]GGI98781.1 hypothetical protein GCM10007978_40720 [Shewanella hanedai]
MVALYQVWKNTEQSKTTFEDSLSKEYRDISKNIPYNALIGKKLNDDEKSQAYNEIFNYMDFCNEQIFLRQSGRVRKNTWNNWQEGMHTNFSLPIFASVSAEVFKELPGTFQELRKVIEQKFNADPNKW